jgi:hypothetical protein
MKYKKMNNIVNDADRYAKIGEAVASFFRDEISVADFAILMARVEAKVMTMLVECDDVPPEFGAFFYYVGELIDNGLRPAHALGGSFFDYGQRTTDNGELKVES